MSGRAWFGGWRLTLLSGAVLALMAAAFFLAAPDPVEGARIVIRMTARTSLILFLLVFTASAFQRLVPSPATEWLRRNRRYIGVSFAISHLIHLAAIVTLARLDAGLFHQLTNIVTYVGGGLGFVFILLMAITSFDRMVVLIGSRAWRLLHVTGAWYLWLSFAINFGKRVPSYSGYAVPVLLIALAAILRFVAARSGEKRPATQA